MWYYLIRLIVAVIIFLSFISALILIRALRKMKSGKKRYKIMRNISAISLFILGLLSSRIAFIEYSFSEEKLVEYFYIYNDLYTEAVDYIVTTEPFSLSFDGTNGAVQYHYDGTYMHGEFISLKDKADDAGFLAIYKKLYRKCRIANIGISEGVIRFTCYSSFTGPTVMFYYSPGYDENELKTFLENPIDENWYKEWFRGF